ncbi:hypothetical protein PPERSA_08183 [Pseudocohnilembus persalinus]|uniref:Uncharacterized protein n=1 Tax=Pseudocohnilembus persalinus TaxID=266149 RepID=A0A0V0R3A4_PSEPJ|nr:hypothetical protein PPERSA_08183 [Pseudocohnilembus persalinus]|eukprot:KRX08980.1 hypothetical protein PPERSA_08183 [Pseudocohnilembus persalinus]
MEKAITVVKNEKQNTVFYQCPFCFKKFLKSKQQLGGHIAKAHKDAPKKNKKRKFSLQEKILNKIGAVVVTIVSLLLLAIFLVYNFLTMGYGIKQYYFVDEKSECKELQLFIMGTSHTMIAQLVIQLCLLINLIVQKLKKNQQNTRWSILMFGGGYQNKNNYQSQENLLNNNDSYFNLNSSLSKNPKSNVEMSTLQGKSNLMY